MLKEKMVKQERELLRTMDHHLTATFKALGDITRLRIFRLLLDQPEVSVSTIAKILRISMPLTSQHIKVLTHAQLLTKKRSGKNVLSRLDRRNPVVLELVRTIKNVLKTKPM